MLSRNTKTSSNSLILSSSRCNQKTVTLPAKDLASLVLSAAVLQKNTLEKLSWMINFDNIPNYIPSDFKLEVSKKIAKSSEFKTLKEETAKKVTEFQIYLKEFRKTNWKYFLLSFSFSQIRWKFFTTLAWKRLEILNTNTCFRELYKYLLLICTIHGSIFQYNFFVQ